MANMGPVHVASWASMGSHHQVWRRPSRKYVSRVRTTSPAKWFAHLYQKAFVRAAASQMLARTRRKLRHHTFHTSFHTFHPAFHPLHPARFTPVRVSVRGPGSQPCARKAFIHAFSALRVSCTFEMRSFSFKSSRCHRKKKKNYRSRIMFYTPAARYRLPHPSVDLRPPEVAK